MIYGLVNSAVRIYKVLLLAIMPAFCFFLTGCSNKEEGGTFPSPEGYNLNKPIVSKLPPMLDEISGIVFYPKDKSLFAIHDERGWLYKIYTDKSNKVEKWKYATGADFEDIALIDSMFFAIKSNGSITAFTFKRPDSPIVKSFKLPKTDKREFETLEKEIARLNAEKQTITEKLSAGSLAYDELQKLSYRIEELAQLLDEKEFRWLELSEIL